MYSRMRPQEDGSIITILPAAVNLTQSHIGGIVCWALIRASKWSSALTCLPDSNRIQLFIWCKIQLAFHLHVPWRWRSAGCRLAGTSRRTLQHEANAALRLHRSNREDIGQCCSSPGRWLLWKETFGMRQRGLRNRMNLPNDSLLGVRKEKRKWGRQNELCKNVFTIKLHFNGKVKTLSEKKQGRGKPANQSTVHRLWSSELKFWICN